MNVNVSLLSICEEALQFIEWYNIALIRYLNNVRCSLALLSLFLVLNSTTSDPIYTYAIYKKQMRGLS